MKNKFLLFGLAAFALTSCSSDDDNSSIDAAKLTKKWYYVSDVVGGVTIPYDDNEACGKDYAQFVAGGVFYDVDVYNCLEESETGTWSLNGNKLTVSIYGESDTATIKKLTSDVLEVQSKFDYDGDGDDETVVQKFTSTP